MTSLAIDQLFAPASSDEWEADMLARADALQLNTTAWEPGSPTLTVLEIVSALMSQEDGLISIVAQAGFLDFAATGTVTFTAANGQTVTQAVTPDPSDPAANPTGALGWLDLLGSSVYDVTRIVASFATGTLAIGNTSVSTLTYPVGTYHVANATTGATFKNAVALSVPQGTLIGTSITAASNGAPINVITTIAHGLSDGAVIVIADVVGLATTAGASGINGIWVIKVTTATSFTLNGSSGAALTPYASGGTVRTTSLVSITADIAGTGGTSIAGSITSQITTNAGVVVSNPATIFGSGFESNVAYAARCRARLAALSPNGPKGALQYFALTASDILGNSANLLFVPPAVVIPAITRAAVFPDKTTGLVVIAVASATGAVGGVTNLLITAVSAGSPIQITTALPHTLVTGDTATITGVIGATAANGTWTITVVDATRFTLNGSVGGAAYTGGGSVEGGVLGQVDRVIQANAVPDTDTTFTVSASDFPVAVAATVSVPTSRVAAYTVAVQTAIALFNAAIPIGGQDSGGGAAGFYRYNDVIGLLYAAGIVGNQPSYVSNISSLTLNGVAADLTFPSTESVASLTPLPVINVVGV